MPQLLASQVPGFASLQAMTSRHGGKKKKKKQESFKGKGVLAVSRYKSSSALSITLSFLLVNIALSCLGWRRYGLYQPIMDPFDVFVNVGINLNAQNKVS